MLQIHATFCLLHMGCYSENNKRLIISTKGLMDMILETITSDVEPLQVRTQGSHCMASNHSEEVSLIYPSHHVLVRTHAFVQEVTLELLVALLYNNNARNQVLKYRGQQERKANHPAQRHMQHSPNPEPTPQTYYVNTFGKYLVLTHSTWLMF